MFPAVDVVVVVDDISLAVGQSRELVVVACLDELKLDHLNPSYFLALNSRFCSHHWGSAEEASATSKPVSKRANSGSGNLHQRIEH